jgi:AGZA family xanthine/uracil permease-like MFS transporter
MPVKVLVAPNTDLIGTPDVPVKIGNLRDPQVLLAIFGFLVIVVLLHRRVRGAILLGMVVTAAAGYALGFGHAPHGIMAMPFVGDYDVRAIAFKLDIAGVLRLGFLPILLTLFLMGFLDTLGTLVGLGAAAGLVDEKGNFDKIERPMMVDALTCMFSGLVGTSTSGAYIESATGIREGARTGLAAVTTAALFAASLFFIPLVEPLQNLRFAYGPALIAVGVLMLGSVKKIRFDDLTELVPAFVTIIMMLFTNTVWLGWGKVPGTLAAIGMFTVLGAARLPILLACVRCPSDI